MKYDYLIVGAGLFGSVCAHELKKRGYSVLIIDKRNHIGGNIYTEKKNNINVHVYGAHIFHTSNELVWKYISSFAEFNSFINMPLANFKGELYHLPFNMNTFTEIWPDVSTKEDAIRHIEEEKQKYGIKKVTNLEEQAINMVGLTIYKKLVKEYTEKQWGRECKHLPPFIIKRLPLRFEYNNNYFDDKYQGIPIGGYTQIIEKLLCGCDVKLMCDFVDNREYFENIANTIIFTGPIDEFFGFKFGKLEYRSLRFETSVLSDISDYQHNAVVNYTSHDVPYTRIIEHKHFEFKKIKGTVITKEYPKKWEDNDIPFYPVNDEKNMALYNQYLQLSQSYKNVVFGGRLGQYKYLDMDDTIDEALKLIHCLMEKNDEK